MIRELLPALVATGARIATYNTPEYLRDVGSPTRHALAERDLAAGRVEALNNAFRRPAIFFDCDGVLNEEPGLQGVVTADDVKLIPGAGAAVRRAREAGCLRSQSPIGHKSPRGLSHSKVLITFSVVSRRCWLKMGASSIASTFVRIIRRLGFPVKFRL